MTSTHGSSSDYLTSRVTNAGGGDTSITFEPDITKPGKYNVLVYTPGCDQDGTCASRGHVNVTGVFRSRSSVPTQTMIYQTNDEDKYDTIYSGHVDAASQSFRPRVTLSAVPGQGDVTMVASQVRFEVISSSQSSSSSSSSTSYSGDDDDGILNGLFQFNPSSTDSNNSSAFSQSAVNNAGMQLEDGASISRLVQNNEVIYAAGNFSGPGIANVMSFSDGNATGLRQGGLNSAVNSLLVSQGSLYVGGNFTDTVDGGGGNLNHLAAYSFGSKSWSALGGGVNGPVVFVAPFPLNISPEINEPSIAVSGDFDQILAFDDNPPSAASGFAVWVPSRKNWLQNLDIDKFGFSGKLSAITTVGNMSILAGSLSSNGLASGGAASLADSSSGPLSLSPFSANLMGLGEGDGIFTGIVDRSSKRNLTIFGGHFTTTDQDGSSVENIMLFNRKDGTVSGIGAGIDASSTILSLAVTNNTLYAGGNVTGRVGGSRLNGFVVYNLTSAEIVPEQPPHLNGGQVVVNSIEARPDSPEVYFGGNFDAAGALPCPSVCYYDASSGQWNVPGMGLSGTVIDLKWASREKLIAVGDLDISGNKTAIATYNAKKQTWSSLNGATAPNVPGTVTAFAPANRDVSAFWLAGRVAGNGSSFLVNYDGSRFRSAGALLGDGSAVRSLDVVRTRKAHGKTSLLDSDHVLVVSGQLYLPGFGNASAALYNGSSLSPFILTTSANGEPASISRMFTEEKEKYDTSDIHHHSNGIIVLISFALALGCVFLIVVAGVILNKIQRRRQGYVRAPQMQAIDPRPSTLTRLPPEDLLNSLQRADPRGPSL